MPECPQLHFSLRRTLTAGPARFHLLVQLGLAGNIVFSPFVDVMDDWLYSSAQMLVSLTLERRKAVALDKKRTGQSMFAMTHACFSGVYLPCTSVPAPLETRCYPEHTTCCVAAKQKWKIGRPQS